MRSENPNNARRHRGPRFNLSTILVLIGIVAWTLSLRPFLQVADYQIGADDGRPAIVLTTRLDPFSMGYPFLRIGPMPPLCGPILAVVAFTTWKLSWGAPVQGAAQWRKQKQTAPTPPPFA